MKNNFIIIAMSGGVDSSVAAWILKKLNYNLLGIFIFNQIDKNNLCYRNHLNDAIRISKLLNIELKLVNYTEFYKNLIFKNYIKNYKLGKIPNPDINCNKKLKFKILLKECLKLGAWKLATGHYAKIIKLNNNYKLIKSKDKKKDQTYFLYKLKNLELSKLIFPLGNLYKFEVRNIAKLINFPNNKKKDSRGICFIETNKFKNFLNNYIKKVFGYILNKKNSILGLHDGIYFYSLGQKKNINLISNKKLYISNKIINKNILYINEYINCSWLLSLGVIVNELFWINRPKNNNYYNIKIRHSQIYIICLIKYINKYEIFVKFNKLQWGLNKGQSIVFYKDKFCLGGGLIKNFISTIKL